MSVPDFYIDPSLQAIIDDCDLVTWCSSEPTTFAQANQENASSGYRIGSAAPSLSIVNGTVSGRAVRQAAITTGTVEDDDPTGTGQFIAFIDTANSRICATCAVSNDQVATDGNTWTLAQLVVWEIEDP